MLNTSVKCTIETEFAQHTQKFTNKLSKVANAGNWVLFRLFHIYYNTCVCVCLFCYLCVMI